jgi:predicted ribosomally synthesized peptide with SipW-like signal peptide
MGKLERIIGLSLAAILIAGLAIGGTWAYLTDTETSNNNGIAAGTLEMKTSVNGSGGPYTNGVTQTLVCSNLKPGRTITATTIQLENVGSTSGGSVNISLSYVAANAANVPVLMTPDQLAGVLQITVLNYDSRSILSLLSTATANGGDGNSYIDLYDMKNEASRLAGLGGLNPGQIRPFDITVQMVSGASNNFVGNGLNITITFTLNQ